MNLIQSQLNRRGTTYDLELNNQTSYYYNKEAETCRWALSANTLVRIKQYDGYAS